MTTPTRPISFYFAPALLVLGTLLAAGNWYLQPERATAWAAALVTLFLFAVLWGAVTLVLRRTTNEAARRHARASIRSGIAFGALIMVLPLAVKLAATLGAIASPDLAQRATMVALGAFFAFTGNAMPKTLTPLAAMQCDGSRVQAFQRFAGWTWALTGLAFAIVWLALPAGVAKPLSLLLLMSGMLIVAAQVVWLRRARQREA